MVFGGTMTRKASDLAPLKETGRPGPTRTAEPGVDQSSATALRPGSRSVSHPAKCGDPPGFSGLRQAAAGSGSTCAHSRPPSTVTGASGRNAAVRRAPTAWVRIRAGPADAARTPEPSSSGRTRSSPATNSRAAAAVYVEPAACCRSAVSRVAVPGAHTGSGSSPSFQKSSQVGASACPGVHSVLK